MVFRIALLRTNKAHNFCTSKSSVYPSLRSSLYNLSHYKSYSSLLGSYATITCQRVCVSNRPVSIPSRRSVSTVHTSANDSIHTAEVIMVNDSDSSSHIYNYNADVNGTEGIVDSSIGDATKIASIPSTVPNMTSKSNNRKKKGTKPQPIPTATTDIKQQSYHQPVPSLTDKEKVDIGLRNYIESDEVTLRDALDASLRAWKAQMQLSMRQHYTVIKVCSISKVYHKDLFHIAYWSYQQLRKESSSLSIEVYENMLTICTSNGAVDNAIIVLKQFQENGYVYTSSVLQSMLRVLCESKSSSNEVRTALYSSYCIVILVLIIIYHRSMISFYYTSLFDVIILLYTWWYLH